MLQQGRHHARTTVVGASLLGASLFSAGCFGTTSANLRLRASDGSARATVSASVPGGMAAGLIAAGGLVTDASLRSAATGRADATATAATTSTSVGVSSAPAATMGVAGATTGARSEAGSVGGAFAGRAEAGGPVEITAAAAQARGRVAAGFRLVDLLDRGTVVDGVTVRIADLTTLAGVVSESPGVSTADGSALFAADATVVADAALEHDQLPIAGGETRLVVRVRGGRPAEAARGRLRLHLVLDRSSSMDESWAQVLVAAEAVIGRLQPTDVLQIVAYGDDAVEVYSPAPVGNGLAARAALQDIRVGGGTNIEAGLGAAYGAMARIPAQPGDRTLVILVSDGRPNVGAFTASEVGRLVGSARVSGSCTTTAVGLGDDFDADVLRAVAREGRGGYYLARTAGELAPPLLGELATQDRVAATDLRIAIRLPAAVTVRSVSDGDAGVARDGNTLTLDLPVLRVGDERRVVITLGVAGSTEAHDIAAVDASYRAGGRVQRGSRRLRMSFGAQARTGAASVALAALDADLANALDVAGTAIRDSDRDAAVAALQAHVQRVRASVAAGADVRLSVRTDAVARIATAVAALMPGAGDGDRRMVGRAFGALAVRIGR